MSFGEYSLPTDTLASILGSYPFSVGLFREGTNSLVDPKLIATQGPSLLAYNDALFADEDWDALQSIHRSSKKTDTSKIGKYGIGFRSCYHITDNPHIISGPSLAILDPHHNFTQSGGTKFEFAPKAVEYADQLDGFDFFLSPNARHQDFPGTIIRLPLRKPGAQSSISSKAVDASEIRQLFEDFVREELGISLLFLKNVQSVEIHEIDAQGDRRCLATSSIQRTAVTSWNVDTDRHTSFKCSVTVETPLIGRTERIWRIAHSYFLHSSSTSLLALRLGQDPRPILSKHKLLSEMAIAIPLSIIDKEETSGRLFTYLPLPLKTGLPVHVHGLFALTQSRQNLNNGGEIGIVRGSEDSVLVEWNHILFESFLPRTWTALLTVLLQDDQLIHVFRAWPPAQPPVFGGDNAYWQSLPAQLLDCILTSKAEVWPVVTGSKAGDTLPHFADLDSVYVAAADVDAPTLRALANAGLRVTQLPEYILQLLKDGAQEQFTLLSPGVAYLDLCKRIGEIHTLEAIDRATLLSFLLQTQKLEYIAGLPIVPLVNGEYLAPTKRGVRAPTHTMLDEAECVVFNGLDEGAISLPSIAFHLRDLFRNMGPTIYNFAILSPEKVASYLASCPLGFDLSHRNEGKFDDTIVDWLSVFWAWLGTWSPRAHLFPHIASLCVVPASANLEALDDGVFTDDGAEPSLVLTFKQLGLAFLHPAFSSAARTALAYYPRVLKSLADIHLVLDRIKSGKHLSLETDDARALSKHVFDCVLQLGGQLPLDDNQRRTLRSLPIFPLLTPTVPPILEKSTRSPSLLASFKLPSLHKRSKSVSLANTSHIADGAMVLGIPSGNTVLLPIVDSVVYLDGSNVALTLLPHLAPSNSSPLTRVDILTLAVEHFSTQPKSLQCAILDHMVQHRDSLPPSLLNSLREIAFIPVRDGRLQSAKHVIDPTKSELVAIYSESRDRIPTTFPDDLLVLGHLRSLGLLPDSLAIDMVVERIQFISSGSTSSQWTLAIQLLTLVNSSGLDCTSLQIPLEAKWLPTNRGLAGRGSCLDIVQKPELFDEVLPVLDGKVTISPTLRIALGWDQPISMSVLYDQLRAVLRTSHTSTLKLDRLIKEFSARTLSDADVAELSKITLDRPWIPISSGRLAATKYATFSSTLGLPGFCQIPFTLADQTEVRKFLLRMGCTERPSSTVLISELKILEHKSHKQDVVDQALSILTVIADDLRAINRNDILVPDSNAILRPVSQVYFNDIGERACLVDPGKHYIAHSKLSDEMSKRLLMDRLGFKSVELSPGIDMGETLTTTIRNVLKQYPEQQICNEFIANACDANATRFGILVDECLGPAGKLLSNSMAPFQNCPSLVFYNSAVFTPKDFEGICRTGIGGKEQRPNTIGQFGLGVLSMFHFTELAMIVSGDSVLFLDPSKTHLPIQGRASLLLPLDQMKRWYPDHLHCLDGLFDFHMHRGSYYNGTLFRLPLRNSSHINANSILNAARITAQYVRDKIVKPYWNSAKHALIFTKLESIITLRRDSSGRQSNGWAISASRGDLQTIFNFRSQVVHIHTEGADPATEDFKVVTASTPLADLPTEFKPLIEPHRLRSSIIVSLGAPLSPSDANHNVFSTLPLPMTTTLPVHLSASFILAPDRRHIRLDDSGDLESKYNRWLLSDVTPPAYLFLLEDLLRTQAALGNERWWPGNIGQQQDTVSKHLVDSFYSTHLATTKRRICASVFETGQLLKPSDILLGGDEPVSVRKILALLNTTHITRLPSKVRERCVGVMKFVDPAFVKSELKSKARSLVSLYNSGQVNLRDIQILTDYLVEDSGPCTGLPLVPLANGKLAVLQESGSTAYYVWRATNPDRPLFPPELLVDPEFKPQDLIAKGLNVTKVTSAAIHSLIKEHFPESDLKTGMKAEDERWVLTFWSEFPRFEDKTQFTTFPLVPTTHPRQYVSLNKCRTKNVILLSNSEPYWLGGLLSDLGAYIVRRDGKDLPKALREALQIYPTFSFDKVLEFFETLGVSSIASQFERLDLSLHTQFADWARGQITRTPERLFPIATALPIWKKLQKEQAVTLHAASELKMLPFGISRDLATRFIGVPSVEHNVSLVHLKVLPMDFNQFWGHLKLPTTLKPEDHQAYKQLLNLMPSHFIFSPDNNILVPNGNLRLVKVNTLYTRHALFVAAFGSDSAPDRFIWESYRDLEVRLVALGLKSHTNLDVDTFKTCARAIQDDAAHPNIVARARIVFRAYGEDMPMRIQSHEQDIWRQLDKLRFVPREPLRRRTMGIQEDSVYVKHLPNIVAPEQVLLVENEAIAWTQRAVLLYPPEERVRVANPSFGEPTPQEVVDHLRVLALQIAKDYTSDVYVLQDLEATYRWLDDRQDIIEDIIIEYHDQPLFLNVNDPRADPWHWHCADEMFFNILDGGDLKSVKKFLMPFKDLLTVAGVENIKHAPVPGVERSTTQTQLAQLREGFQAMRVQGKLTDVVIVTDDDARYPAHRAFLAPMSEYLNDLFCGSFTESGPGTAEEPIEIELDYPGPCIDCILDFIYIGKTPDLERLGDLLDVMDLSNYWGLTELNLLIQTKIIGSNHISPATYEEVLARATALDAQLLLNACEFFERENRDAILRLKGEYTGKRRTPKRLPKKTLAARTSVQSTSSTATTLKPKPKKVIKGFMKSLRKVGDSFDFLS